MLDMKQKGFFYIRISYKIKTICETQLSAEDRSLKEERRKNGSVPGDEITMLVGITTGQYTEFRNLL